MGGRHDADDAVAAGDASDASDASHAGARPARPGDRRRLVLRLAAFALALAAAFALVGLLVARSPPQLRDAAEAAGGWAPAGFVALCVGLTLAFFPYPLVAAAGGLLFGTLQGTLLAIAGGTAGAVLAFLIARHVASDAVARLAGERVARLQDAIARRGFVAVLYARIVPGVPRDLANYAFGLTRVGLVAFTLATLIGIAPRAFAYTALGGQLGSLDSTESVVAIATLVAIGLLGLELVRRDVAARREAAARRDGPRPRTSS